MASGIAVGCGSSDSGSGDNNDSGSEDKTLKLAMFGFSQDNPHAALMAKSFERELDASGGEFTFFDGNFDAATQANQIQDAVSSGRYNAFVIEPIDPGGLDRAMEDVADIATVPLLFSIGTDVCDVSSRQTEGVTTTIAYSPCKNGQLSSKATNDACEGKDNCRTVIFMGDRTLPFDKLTLDGLKAGLDPNVEIVRIVDADYTRAGGLAQMENVLQTTKDIDVIVSPGSDAMIAGAEQALTQAGIKVGDDNPDDKFNLIGLGACRESVKAIRQGRWEATVTYLGDPSLTNAVLDSLSSAVKGETPPKAVDVYELAPVGPLTTEKSLKEKPDFEGEWDC